MPRRQWTPAERRRARTRTHLKIAYESSSGPVGGKNHGTDVPVRDFFPDPRKEPRDRRAGSRLLSGSAERTLGPRCRFATSFRLAGRSTAPFAPSVPNCQRAPSSSEPSQEDGDAAEVKEGQEVLRLVLPSDGETTELLQPGKKPFHLPSTFVAPQPATVLPAAKAV